MAPSLLRIAALLLLCQLAPSSASAQYLFADTNGDSICDPYDHFENGLDTVWIWIDTNHDLFGGVVTCPTGEDLTISDYELCLDVSSYATGYQPVTVGKWINKVPEFTDSLGFHVGTNGPTRVHVYYSSSGASNHLPPGKRLLGGLEVTMAPRACNRVYFAPRGSDRRYKL